MASTPVFKSPQFRQRRLPGRRLPRTIPSTPPTSSPQGARQTLRRESLYRRGTGSEGRRTTFALHAEVPPNNANGRWIPPRSGAPDRTRTCGTEIRNLVQIAFLFLYCFNGVSTSLKLEITTVSLALPLRPRYLGMWSAGFEQPAQEVDGKEVLGLWMNDG